MFSYHQNTMKKALWIQEFRKLVLVEIVGFFSKSSTNQKSKLRDENILFKKEVSKSEKYNTSFSLWKSSASPPWKKDNDDNCNNNTDKILDENNPVSFPAALQPGLQTCR